MAKILDFFKAKNPNPSPRFTIMVNGFDEFSVKVIYPEPTFTAAAMARAHKNIATELYFKNLKFPTLEAAKKAIDLFLYTEEQSVKRPVCQYP